MLAEALATPRSRLTITAKFHPAIFHYFGFHEKRSITAYELEYEIWNDSIEKESLRDAPLGGLAIETEIDRPLVVKV